MILLSTRRFIIPDQALIEIGEYAKRSEEYGGFLYPEPDKSGSWIAILENISNQPHVSMQFNRQEFIEVGTEYLSYTPYQWEDLTVWHTHPGGNIGPSRIDMKNKINEMGNLVVTIVNSEVIPTWF